VSIFFRSSSMHRMMQPFRWLLARGTRAARLLSRSLHPKTFRHPQGTTRARPLSASAASSLLPLPSDLLMFVAAFLSVRDLDAFCGVCHTVRDVLHTVEHWRSLCCGAHPLAKWYPGTTIQAWRRHHNVLQKLPTRIESWSVPSGATIEVTGRGLHIFTGPSERGEFTSNLFVSGLSAPLYYFEITVLPNVGLEIPRIGLSLGAKLPKGEEPTEGVTAETLQLVSGSGGFTKSHIFRTTSPPHFFATIQNGQACWKPGDVVGLGMFTRTDWRGFESVGFHTHNGRFVETFSPPGCDTKKAPLYPTVEIGAGQRIAINLGAAPFAFDLTTLRGPGEDEPGYQWEFSEPPRN